MKISFFRFGNGVRNPCEAVYETQIFFNINFVRDNNT